MKSHIPLLTDREFDTAFVADDHVADCFSIDRLRDAVTEQSYMALLLVKACGLETPSAAAPHRA